MKKTKLNILLLIIFVIGPISFYLYQKEKVSTSDIVVNENEILVEDINPVNNNDTIPSRFKEISYKVHLESIKIQENTTELVITMSGFDGKLTDFMKDLTYEYINDYNVLRIVSNNYPDYRYNKLVHDFDISSIKGSNYIKSIDESFLYGDHYSGIDISLKKAMTFEVEEDPKQGQIIIRLSPKNSPVKKRFLLRSVSLPSRVIFSHHEFISYHLLSYDSMKSPSYILSDEDGYFYVIRSFDSKVEAIKYLNSFMEYLNQYKAEFYFDIEKEFMIVESVFKNE